MLLAMDTVINGMNMTAWGMIMGGGIGAVAMLILMVRKLICCNTEIEATVVSHKMLHVSGNAPEEIRKAPPSSVPGAIYSYTYEGQTYTTAPMMNSDGGCDPVGTVRTLKINPKKPSECRRSGASIVPGYVLLIVICALIVFGGIWKLNGL